MKKIVLVVLALMLLGLCWLVVEFYNANNVPARVAAAPKVNSVCEMPIPVFANGTFEVIFVLPGKSIGEVRDLMTRVEGAVSPAWRGSLIKEEYAADSGDPSETIPDSNGRHVFFLLSAQRFGKGKAQLKFKDVEMWPEKFEIYVVSMSF